MSDESDTQETRSWRHYRTTPCGHTCSGENGGNGDDRGCSDDESAFIQRYVDGHGYECHKCGPDLPCYEQCIGAIKDVQGNCGWDTRPCSVESLVDTMEGGICPWENFTKMAEDAEFKAKWENYIPEDMVEFIPPKENRLAVSNDYMPAVAEEGVHGWFYDDCARCQVPTSGAVAEGEAMSVELTQGEVFEILCYITEPEVYRVTINGHEFLFQPIGDKLKLYRMAGDAAFHEHTFTAIGETYEVNHTGNFSNQPDYLPGWPDVIWFKWVDVGSYYLQGWVTPPEPTPPPSGEPPQTTNDPHVCTFFGEKYDM